MMVWVLAQDAFWAGVTAVGFAILFSVPRRDLPGAFLTGAAGHCTRALLAQWGVPLEGATLAGAVVVGVLGNLLAQRLHKPTFVFTVPGVIPMVPGVFAFQTMMGILRVTTAAGGEVSGVLVDAGINAIHTALLLGALALGISVPRLLFRHPRPVV
ncbi:MAG: threonine/serine exporter family protein [Anaerolineales bacterium]|nr:threonine/serine exporter family protein [Anaerolineales bacterium]MCB8952608.1 threonine/serine exporter family protein [Ardenticatenales bacterium]